MTTVAVLNAGGWGTALAALLARGGHDVRLWCRRPEQATALAESRENAAYLPGVPLAMNVTPTDSMGQALDGASVVILVPISKGMRELARGVAPLLAADTLVVHGTKGLELPSMLRMSEVVEQELGEQHHGRVAALSGPTHAEEVGRGIPTAAVVACTNHDVGDALQSVMNCATFRIYTNRDVVGVELCGAMKNVVAIAAGMGDGLGGGDNAKAALMTRSLAEITRLVRAAGGQGETVAGLAGIGDLVATCTSQHSRNRRAGEQIGTGWPIEKVVGESRQVVEGVPATRAAVALAERWGVEMPIARQVHKILFEGASPLQALAELMARDPTQEH